MELNTKIDIVIPYVNGNDSEWLKIYEKHNTNDKHYATIRFDGNDILKYVLRSIDLYLPWINNIHLLVMMDSQVPEWVNREKVHVVYHKDFIPESLLPVFNSTAIEMFLWNIPELSEQFIYINDDMMFNQTLEPNDFFSDDKMCYVLNHAIYKNFDLLNAAYIGGFINSAKLAAYGTNVKYHTYQKVCLPAHFSSPFYKSKMQNAYKENELAILASISKLREEKNLNYYMKHLEVMLKNQIEMVNILL